MPIWSPGRHIPTQKIPKCPPPRGLMRDIMDWNSGQFCLNVYCLNENRYLCIKCKERSIDCTSALMFVLPILRLSRNWGTPFLNIPCKIFTVPYLSCGLIVWGQASKTLLTKILLLQKKVLRFIFLANRKVNAIPLLIDANILPISFLYFKSVSFLMHDIHANSAPSKMVNLFS